jgi:hypothetical protein
MRLVLLGCLLLAVLVAGCGSKSDAASTVPPAPPIETATTEPVPVLTTAADIAACNSLGRNFTIVSQMVKNASDQITLQSLHYADLAKHVEDAREVMLYAVRVLQLTDTPKALDKSRDQLVSGFRSIAGDYKRARPLVLKKNMAGAASELADAPAFQKIATASKRIEKACKA